MAKTTIKLPDRFDINQVEQMQSRMQTALNKGADVIEISAVAVRLVDSSGMQLLLSFVNEAQAKQMTVKLLKQSAEFVTATGLLGVTGLFDEISA